MITLARAEVIAQNRAAGFDARASDARWRTTRGGRTCAVVTVAVERRRARDEAERRHVRHVRRERAQRGGVLRSRAVGARRVAVGRRARDEVRVRAVARAPSLAPVAVDGRLELARRAVLLLLALVRVEILHVPVERAKRGERARG